MMSDSVLWMTAGSNDLKPSSELRQYPRQLKRKKIALATLWFSGCRNSTISFVGVANRHCLGAREGLLIRTKFCWRRTIRLLLPGSKYTDSSSKIPWLPCKECHCSLGYPWRAWKVTANLYICHAPVGKSTPPHLCGKATSTTCVLHIPRRREYILALGEGGGRLLCLSYKHVWCCLFWSRSSFSKQNPPWSFSSWHQIREPMAFPFQGWITFQDWLVSPQWVRES